MHLTTMRPRLQRAVHLTEKREELGERNFHHLLSKEVGRAASVNYLCASCLTHLPRLVRQGKIAAGWGAAIAMFAFTGSSAIFSILSRSIIWMLKRTLGGVPVLTFFDAPRHDEVGDIDHGPATAVQS